MQSMQQLVTLLLMDLEARRVPQHAQAFLNDLQRRKDVERYVKGYLEHPEQAEEVEGVRSASYAALNEEPWD